MEDSYFTIRHTFINIYIDKFNLLETQEVANCENRPTRHEQLEQSYTQARDTPSPLASSILWYGALLLTGGVVIIAWPVVTDHIYLCIFMLIHLSSEKYNRTEYLAAGSVVSASTTQSNPGFREQLKVAWCISFYSRAGFLLSVWVHLLLLLLTRVWVELSRSRWRWSKCCSSCSKSFH